VPKRLTVRPLTEEEVLAVGRLARSRTAPARAVERARIVRLAHAGWRVPAIARAVGVGEQTARRWVKRFDAAGLAGLADAGRPGRPPTYTPEAVGEAVAASLTPPQELGLPCASWTLDRLAAYLGEERGVAIERSRLGEILADEGLRWRTQETWFGARPDPAFAEQRGPSSPSTGTRPRTPS
jgi:transposase